MKTKHIFSISLAKDKTNQYFDDTPFTTKRISPFTRKAQEQGTKEFTKAVMKSMNLPQLLIGYILIGLGIIVLGGFLEALPDTDFMTALNNGKWLLVGGAASVALGGGLLLYHKHHFQKQEESEDIPDGLDEPLNSLDAVSRRINMELNLPEDDQLIGVEILPYRYKPTSDGDTREVLDNGCFENTEVFFWREDDYLCVTDYDSVMKLPVTAVEGYYTADVKYKISYWIKDEEYNAGEYAQYNIKEDSETNYKLRTYYRVMLREGETRYEIRVPCYDFPKFQKIVGAACLDDKTTS
ncbi:MAG: hypothetical protein IKM33_04165 [Clostridia bacterium]|nr:hypothetical protein [Clostridia bacterium]